jgi:hypothetical protein
MDAGDKSQDSSEQDERELVESITPDVMRVLVATGFVALDDHLCPADASATAEKVSEHAPDNVIHPAIEGLSG